MKYSTQLFTILVFTIIILSACQSTPPEIEEGLNPAELFQRAQEAVINDSDYETAMAYYEAVLERFPNDIQNRVIAEYEIAFLYHKMGDDKKAKQLFSTLLEKYEGEKAQVLPQWPKVLSEKLISIIEEEGRRKKEQEAEPSSET